MDISVSADELYVIEQVKKLKTNDLASAKSWIITAKTLYPNNFNVQVSKFYLVMLFCFK